ncbi:choice-of-anchor A family protein [Leucobacter viscericola]|uniref:Choice-of-anchor A family protein n=1 Tax=Leucobacter viscericola TaxID=2714935 RepID=A0A6G7XC30_9MICO|nr:choice-of-anchor A family protein [Leucobacter viscericola]QIK61931.1 choice-of-anchor A family protein [Leucobacter viscericola]
MRSTANSTLPKWRLPSTIALTAGLFCLIPATQPAPAFANSNECPPGSESTGLWGGGHRFDDQGVAVYVGGDYSVTTGAQESEGLLVIEGNVNFAPGRWFNLGTVGIGSGITPVSGSDMLMVKGDLGVTLGTVEVGHGLENGGNVRVGGDLAVSAGARLQTNGGTTSTRLGNASTSDYGDLAAALPSFSAELATEPTTGIVTRTGNRLRFSGSGSGRQVFEVSAADLNASREFTYFEVPAEEPIIINVTGDTVNVRPNYQAYGTQRIDDTTSSLLGQAASQILWNFTDATSVTIGHQDQFIGSVLVPSPSSSVLVTTSTSGRLYAAGDVVFGGAGTDGIEQHNYPWIGGELMGCSPIEPPTVVVPPVTPNPPNPPETPETPETPENPTPTEKDPKSPPTTSTTGSPKTQPKPKTVNEPVQERKVRELAQTGTDTEGLVFWAGLFGIVGTALIFGHGLKAKRPAK